MWKNQPLFAEAGTMTARALLSVTPSSSRLDRAVLGEHGPIFSRFFHVFPWDFQIFELSEPRERWVILQPPRYFVPLIFSGLFHHILYGAFQVMGVLNC